MTDQEARQLRAQAAKYRERIAELSRTATDDNDTDQQDDTTEERA
jgi:hypothetical protein